VKTRAARAPRRAGHGPAHSAAAPAAAPRWPPRPPRRSRRADIPAISNSTPLCPPKREPLAHTLPTTLPPPHHTGILKRLRGRAAELLRHPAGAHVLDDLYAAADGRQRAALAAEFYGREYALFEGGELNGLAGVPRRLADLLAAVDGAKARAVMGHLAAALAPILDKGLVDCQLAHRLLAEYMAAAPASLVAEAATALSGPALLHMAHTREGAAAACAALAHGSARDRKAAARALKGHAGALARDEWGHALLLTALTAVDDTELLKKCVARDLQVRGWL
jgi:pumilio family protein 6